MYLTLDEVQKMNAVQLEIFKEFVKVCKKLDLKYYMAHGSLLGTLRYEGFFPFDDDIDLLMPRKDYDRLLKEGQALLPSKYFVQSCKTEKEYPLAFAKIRDSETAFIQPVMENFNVNMGIYIDIFPLDYYPENKFTQKYLVFINKVYSLRINLKMNYEEKQPILKNLLRGISVLLCPSWEKTVQRRAGRNRAPLSQQYPILHLQEYYPAQSLWSRHHGGGHRDCQITPLSEDGCCGGCQPA